MATLSSKLEAAAAEFHAKVPAAVSEIVNGAVEDAKKKFAGPVDVIKAGEAFPSFTLPNAVGTPVSSSELLTKGPLLVTFYRGNWCPFCNIALHGLQERLDEIEAHGVQLVAISPELPDSSLSTQEKNGLRFPVLSDEGNKLARELGIVWKQPDNLKAMLQQSGVVSPNFHICALDHLGANKMLCRTWRSEMAMIPSRFPSRLRS